MMSITKWFIAAVAITVLAGTARADIVSNGTVKSINADAKTFVLMDSAKKDFTFAIGADMVVNRGGKESKSGLKAGDAIYVSYNKGVLTWTAIYILVREGKTKNCELVRGFVKGYDTEKQTLAFTEKSKEESTYPMGKAQVRINMEDAVIGKVKIGDRALLVIEKVDGNWTLHSLMVDRAT